MKIGMRSLKDWANQKQLNEAIQANLRQVANETADEYLDKPPPAQTGNVVVVENVDIHLLLYEVEKNKYKIVFQNDLDYKHV